MASVISVAGASALATTEIWLLPLLIAPLAAAWWAARTGVDANDAGLRIRRMLRTQHVAWSETAGLSVAGNRVLAELHNGQSMALPAVTPTDVPALLALAQTGSSVH